MNEEIRYLGDVQRLVLNPGDTVVLTIDSIISEDTALRLKTQLQNILGDGYHYLVLSDGMKIGVLGQDIGA